MLHQHETTLNMRSTSLPLALLLLPLLPHVLSKADPAGLRAEIDALGASIHAANDKAQALLKDDPLTPFVPKCIALYKNAIASLVDVHMALQTGDEELMQASLSSIDDLALSCEDKFNFNNLPSPLKDKNLAIESAALACIRLALKSSPFSTAPPTSQ